MSVLGNDGGALDWVLDKLAAAKKQSAKASSAQSFKPKTPKAPDVTAKIEKLKGVRAFEQGLWHQYKKSGKPDDYKALLQSHIPLMRKEVGRFKGVEIDKVTMEVEWMKLHKKAVDSFNPTKSALNTWITNKTHLNRFVSQRQNVLRPSEPKNAKIGRFKTGFSELASNLGREPSLQEVSEHTKLPMKTVVELSRVARGTYDIDAGGDEVTGNAPAKLNTMTMAAKIVYPDLSAEEKLLHDYMFPKDGRKIVSTTNELSKKTGFDVPKVSKLKTSILKKMEEWIPD